MGIELVLMSQRPEDLPSRISSVNFGEPLNNGGLVEDCPHQRSARSDEFHVRPRKSSQEDWVILSARRVTLRADSIGSVVASGRRSAAHAPNRTAGSPGRQAASGPIADYRDNESRRPLDTGLVPTSGRPGDPESMVERMASRWLPLRVLPAIRRRILSLGLGLRGCVTGCITNSSAGRSELGQIDRSRRRRGCAGSPCHRIGTGRV